MPIRLVKGSPIPGSTSAVHTFGEQTDIAYLRLARLARMAYESTAPLAIATHDRAMREALLPTMPDAAYEMMLGVRNDDADDIIANGHTVRGYVPYGPNWYRYFAGRLLDPHRKGA